MSDHVSFIRAWDEITQNAPYRLESERVTQVIRTMTPISLVVINGPAGAGKSTVGKILESNGLKRIPRVTTRPRRDDEVHGKDYHFVEDSVFHEFVSQGKIAAAKTTYGFWRGFFKEAFVNVQDNYTEGESSLKAIEETGIDRNSILHIFLLPPSGEEWLSRLQIQHKKGHFSEEEFTRRLQEGVQYLKKSTQHFKTFPRSIYLVNDDLGRIEAIISALLSVNTGGDPQSKIIQGTTRISTKQWAHTNRELHIISALHLFDKKGNLLIQKRHNNGLWDHSAAGHMQIGETPEQTIQRELREELGLSLDTFKYIGEQDLHHKQIPNTSRHHCFLFTSTTSVMPVNLQASEVEEIMLVNIKELQTWIEKEPEAFSGGFLATLSWLLECL